MFEINNFDVGSDQKFHSKNGFLLIDKYQEKSIWMLIGVEFRLESKNVAVYNDSYLSLENS